MRYRLRTLVALLFVAPPLAAWGYFNVEPMFRLNRCQTGKYVDGVSWREAIAKSNLVSNGHGTTISKDTSPSADSD